MTMLQFFELLSYMATALGFPVGIFMLWHTVRSFEKTVELSHYSNFDQMYADLLKLAIGKPHFRILNAPRTTEQAQDYDNYAHLCWCFVETLHDHSLRVRSLNDTWESAILIEAWLHRDWFERHDNAHKFSQRFRTFIATEFPRDAVEKAVQEGHARIRQRA